MNDNKNSLMISAYANDGFRLNNGTRVFGPIAILPIGVFSWKVGGVDDINEQSMALFSLLNPKPSMILLGKD